MIQKMRSHICTRAWKGCNTTRPRKAISGQKSIHPLGPRAWMLSSQIAFPRHAVLHPSMHVYIRIGAHLINSLHFKETPVPYWSCTQLQNLPREGVKQVGTSAWMLFCPEIVFAGRVVLHPFDTHLYRSAPLDMGAASMSQQSQKRGRVGQSIRRAVWKGCRLGLDAAKHKPSPKA